MADSLGRKSQEISAHQTCPRPSIGRFAADRTTRVEDIRSRFLGLASHAIKRRALGRSLCNHVQHLDQLGSNRVFRADLQET